MFFYSLIFLLFWGCSSPEQKEDSQPSVQLTANYYNYGFTNKNLESLDFFNRSREYGLEGIVAERFNVIDFNNDGYSDLVIVDSQYAQPQFFEYLPKQKKFIKTEDLFEQAVIASYLIFADFNHDNILDVVVGVLNQRSELSKLPVKIFQGSFKNGKLSFAEVKNAIKLEPMPTTTVTVFDYDLDGELDLYIGNWFGLYQDKPIPIKDYLFKGNGFQFKDVSHTLVGENDLKDKVFHLNAKPTYSVSTCDIDRNGFPDILTTSTSRYPNKLWMNVFTLKEGNREFVDYGMKSYYSADVEGRMDPRGGGRSFFSACADYNNDSMMDVYLGELSYSYDPLTVDKSSILTGTSKNFPPEFLRTEYMNDTDTINWNQGDRRGIWIDLNFDGLLDLLVDNSGFPPQSRLVLFEQQQNHAFENVAPKAGVDILNPTGSVILDINRDGKPDIITAQSKLRNAEIKNTIYVFENHYAYDGKRILRLYPRGKLSNSLAIGAMINLTTLRRDEEVTKRYWVEYSQGALPSQNEEGIFFGLEKAEKILSLSVTWPYSKTQKDQSPQALEKSYKLNVDTKYYSDFTLCENGRFYPGKRVCD
ncbi:MAG: VCBS repeat-containing protein [Bacteriovoracaceae bacterium]|nr:VCBS repeat-containing protein [Bacteriovoracaceae bacterium]